MGVIIFNGVSSEDFNIVVEHPPKYEYPEKEYTSVHVPGRNGDILNDTGTYKNTKRTYEIAVGDLEISLYPQANKIAEWLHSADGYCRLEDSYDPEVYRMAAYVQSASIDNLGNHMGRVTIEFNCKPQRFYKSGENPIKMESSVSYINNGTNFIARPYIMIYGSAGSFAIGDSTITFENISNCLIIDSDIQDVYEYTSGSFINANNKVTISNGYPVLMPGLNSLAYSGSVSSVEVIPRWWTI